MSEYRKISGLKIFFWVGVVLLILAEGVLLLFWNRLPPQLPWFYSLPWGEKQLVDKMWLVWIFAGLTGVLFLTRIISKWSGKDDRVVQTTVIAGGVMAVILALASFVRVMAIFLNT